MSIKAETVVVIDKNHFITDFIKKQITEYYNEILVINDVTYLKLNQKVYSVGFITSSTLRVLINTKNTQSLLKIKTLIVLSPCPFLEEEKKDLEELNISHIYELKTLKENISDIKNQFHIFDINILLSQGFEKEQAKDTAKQAVKEVIDSIKNFKQIFPTIDITKAIENIHKINNVMNFCGFIRSKKMINQLELQLKESLYKNQSISISEKENLLLFLEMLENDAQSTFNLLNKNILAN
jgi:hypothetical protein